MTASNVPKIFDRKRWRRARARAAATFSRHDFLHRRAFGDIVERLEAASRSFDCALLYGVGGLSDMLTADAAVRAFALADLDAARIAPGTPSLVMDEERSPLAPQRFDLIVSLLTLHAANDLVGALAQHRMALKPDGLFIAAVLAEETLRTLRRAFYAAEAALKGGVAPRLAPFGSARDLGDALQRAGFALPVVDIDNVEVRYSEPARLLSDLKGMGETGFLAARSVPLTSAILTEALAEFARNGGVERFDIAFLTAFAPHSSQQQPLKPGTAEMSMERAVKGA